MRMLSFAFLAATASAASTADRTVSFFFLTIANRHIVIFPRSLVIFLSEKRKIVRIMLYLPLKVAKNLSPNYYKDSETPQYITTNYGIVRHCAAPKFECKFMDTFRPNRIAVRGAHLPRRPEDGLHEQGGRVGREVGLHGRGGVHLRRQRPE